MKMISFNSVRHSFPFPPSFQYQDVPPPSLDYELPADEPTPLEQPPSKNASSSSMDTDAETDSAYQYISNPYRYIFAGLVFFVIPAVAFVLLGGVQWLRRVTGWELGASGRPGSRRGKYSMVRDLEK